MNRASELMSRAKTAASLENFGEDSFREGLEVLVASADREARLNELGKAVFDSQIVDLLVSRLQVEDWYARHPEIDEQEIVAPLIGLGQPRAGSTALHFLLAEDPAVRFVRSWEALWPCPPPETATEHIDPRIERAKQAAAQRDVLFPRMKAMVPSSPTGPVECQTFISYNFQSQYFEPFAQIPTYTEWLIHKADLVPTYRYLKRVLKLLQWRCPPTRWRLKNPTHPLFINALVEVFPDARFWITHRDITRVIPSLANLYYELAKALSDEVDKHYLGRVVTERTELAMRRLIAFRDRGQEHRFFDIDFVSFQKDPYPILAQLYDFIGEEFTEETRARMEAWRRSTPPEKYEANAPEDFGIDLNALSERFRFYSERFNVASATADR